MINNVQILGQKELDEILTTLPKAVSKSLKKRALKNAAKPMEQAAVDFAPRRKRGGTTRKTYVRLSRKGKVLRSKSGARKTGTHGPIHKAIKTVAHARAKEAEVWVAPTTGRNVEHDAWYARFHEFGTKGFGKRNRSLGVTFGYAKKSKSGTGLPARPFMSKSFDQKHKQSIDMIDKELSKVVVKYLRRKAPKYYAA